jgi:hypothetical protein
VKLSHSHDAAEIKMRSRIRITTAEIKRPTTLRGQIMLML